MTCRVAIPVAPEEVRVMDRALGGKGDKLIVVVVMGILLWGALTTPGAYLERYLLAITEITKIRDHSTLQLFPDQKSSRRFEQKTKKFYTKTAKMLLSEEPSTVS